MLLVIPTYLQSQHQRGGHADSKYAYLSTSLNRTSPQSQLTSCLYPNPSDFGITLPPFTATLLQFHHNASHPLPHTRRNATDARPRLALVFETCACALAYRYLVKQDRSISVCPGVLQYPGHRAQTLIEALRLVDFPAKSLSCIL